MSDNSIIISLKNIHKSFGSNTILDNLSLDIEQGKAITFIGHNGTGKSTLLKIISKLINIDSGSITYYPKSKHSPLSSDTLSVSYIPEQFPRLNMTAVKYLTHMAGISGLNNAESKELAAQMLDKFFMGSMRDTKLIHLSKGSLQKVSVIQALITIPDVILLDEPVSGQDIASQKVLINMINELKDKGMTVIMSCHERFLMNRISDIIYEIKNGKLIPAELNTNDMFDYDTLIIDISKLQREYSSCKSQIYSLYKEQILQFAELNNSPDARIIQITIDSQYSNSLLLMLLNNGAVLKEMHNESL